ncbi:sugar ABC transporter ATP-binding protein [soil metagenome]|jgi:ribose transport system ATP-binding protein|nr:sugar ABC transporter ATP-binding protein [Euzebyaceae bacterium]
MSPSDLGGCGGDSAPLCRAVVEPPVVVEVAGLSKAYGGVTALERMDLRVRRGRVHAVVGENGAGKSTLMKILAGAVSADSGSIRLDGRQVELGSPRAAQAHGMGIVYQELSLFPDRSVLANLFVDREPRRMGLVSRRRMAEQAAPVLASVGLDVDPDTPVGRLTIGERQLVEIARVLLEDPRVVILDEPNSALNDAETRRLFSILRQLVTRDIAILYVSHRLEEVFEIADAVTVMRNGRPVLSRPVTELHMAEVIRAMVGRDQGELFPPRRPPVAGRRPPALEVRGLTVGEDLVDVSFGAAAGEVVGLAGLEGAGVATLLGAIFGTRRPAAGDVTCLDAAGLPSNPTRAARRGISLVPADRRNQGLMLDNSVLQNLSHVSVGAIQRGSWLRRGSMAAAAGHQVQRLRIKTPSLATHVGQLSGGNQQKVVIGKWLEIQPRLVLLDDPTRGVDIGAKREIYQLIREMADGGGTILFRSTELSELRGLADRILVFYRGRLTTECPPGIASHDLLHAVNTGSLPAASP